MRREWLWRACLLVAGTCTAGLGVYHFLLPSVFRWSEYVHGEPAPIWAIFAMNAMLSFLGFLGLKCRLPGTPTTTLSCALANRVPGACDSSRIALFAGAAVVGNERCS